jgi:hypothetical protein
MGKEGEPGLLYLHGSYYLAESVPHAGKLTFQAKLGGGRDVTKKVKVKQIILEG